MQDPIVIVAARRTPIGNMLGDLSTFTAPQLGSAAIKAVLADSRVDLNSIDEVIMGCVLPAGLGQAPARQAAIGAEIPVATGALTINKMCGSGLKAVMLAHDVITGGSAQLIVAGGMESMSNAPYLLMKGRQGYRLGHQTIYDHMFIDGLEDSYERGKLMGAFAEETAQHFGFTREIQDEFAIGSITRAQRSTAKGYFTAEITPLAVDSDEGPRKARMEKIPQLKPAFRENGTVTAANSSSISDGAAALIITRASHAEKNGMRPLARIVAHNTHSQLPKDFTTAPIGAIQGLLTRTGWSSKDVDLFEINEAFAVVTLAAIRELKLNPEKVNIHGGACTLGHPIGASGARILVTLLHALQTHGLQRGIASLCIGGGEAVAIAIERM